MPSLPVNPVDVEYANEFSKNVLPTDGALRALPDRKLSLLAQLRSLAATSESSGGSRIEGLGLLLHSSGLLPGLRRNAPDVSRRVPCGLTGLSVTRRLIFSNCELWQRTR